VRRKSGISIKYNVLDYCCKVAVSRLRFFLNSLKLTSTITKTPRGRWSSGATKLQDVFISLFFVILKNINVNRLHDVCIAIDTHNVY